MMESKWEPVSESMQNVSQSSASMSKSGGGIKAEGVKNGDFPAGLRVLVVDDDPICLLILDRLLRECHYQVRTCDSAVRALELLREKKDSFDLVISDVHMPDMDGFKLLEHVGLEMDLPVIMMSANSDTSAVMKGVVRGASDYLLKPVRLEELKNIWQHVLRKQNKVPERPSKQRHFTDDGDSNTSGTHLRKRKSFKEEDEEEDEEEEEEGEDERDRDNDDPSSAKKPRVVWSVELHQQFVNAVNQLGIDKAVPKRILELMNVQSLTRENVASHLQKYRLYLKRIHGHPQGALSSPFSGASDSGFGFVMGGESNSLAAAHLPQHLPQQALISSLQAGLFGKLNTANLGTNTGIDPTLFLQFASTHGLDNEGLVKSLYGQPSQYGQAASLSNAGSDLKQGGQHAPGLSQYGQSSQYGQASLSNAGPDLKKGGQHTLGLSQYGQPLQYAQASSDLKQGGQHTSGLPQYGQPSQYGQAASFSNASPDLKLGVQHTPGLSQYGQPLQYGQASPELKQAGQPTPGLSQYGQPLQYGQTSLPDANPALKQGGQYTSGFSQYSQPSQYGQASLLNGGPDLKHGAQHTPGLSPYSQTSQYAQASLSNAGPDLKQGGQHTPGLSQYGQTSQYGQPSQYVQTSSSNAIPDLKPGGQHTPVLSGLQDNNLVGPNGMRQLGKSGSLLAGDHPNGNALIMQIGKCSGFDISNEDAVQMRSGHLSPLVASNPRLDRFPQSESKEPHTLSGSLLQIPSKLKGSPTLIPSSHHNDLDASDVKRLGTHGLATLAGLDYSTHDLGMSSRIPKAWEHSQPGLKSGQIQIQHSVTNTQIYDGLAKNQIDRAGEQGLAQESVLSDHHKSSIPLALVADGSGRFKSSLRNTPYNNGPSAPDVEWKVKEVSLGLSASKVGNSSLAESFQPSDDLLNFVLKQQQGGLGFTDNGMATDGFRLNEM